MVWATWAFALAKFIHVLLATIWVGALFFVNVALLPMVNKTTPGTRREMMGLMGPASIKSGNALGGLTLLSGVVLLWGNLDVHGLTWGNFYEDGWGKFVAFALIMNLLILYLLNFSFRPTVRAIGKIMPEVAPDAPPPPTLVFLQRRMTFVGRLALVLILLALAAMVIANTGWLA